MSAKDSDQKLDQIVAQARTAREQSDKGYRAKALKMYPWICGRCSREFNQQNLRELTVHHRDHNHDNNPQDGSNWELLCLYCHDNEHARYIDNVAGDVHEDKRTPDASHNPFAGLANLLQQK
ncbi:MAG: YajD family HNH nuclease [Cycloclasticus sp.]|nr:HNH endonuclease [Cycloclasticus sp. 46_83_sub15_T18]